MHPQSGPLGEFDLIQRFFKTGADSMSLNKNHNAIALGIGDDCALIKFLGNEEIAITSDMLVEGRHFFATANPEQLGYKALAVNLSDLAAMGAKHAYGFYFINCIARDKFNLVRSFCQRSF